ncbi:MAG: LL-diaminopimelate aminotransferase [Chlamydiia bacterium]|nr:LL-diaminopimelate aminotransferase [Chlamydiia bacterium]
MPERNASIATLKAGYLFPEITRRKEAFLKERPSANLISLGIGDTTEPLSPYIVKGLVSISEALGTPKGYKGYGTDQGEFNLREKIAKKLYRGQITPDEIFLADGAKCDLGRLQLLFGPDTIVAIQDPAYPVYVDTTLISGKKPPILLPCTPENQFFPDLATLPSIDVLFWCSPNNPTGAVSTKKQLKSLVDWAISNRTILVFDAAYSHFIQDPDLPKSIFEIDGADQCAIEVNSFSKMAGFTGVRLSWTAVPKTLKFNDGSSVYKDWQRISSTFFNGPSHIPQGGALALLEDEGLLEAQKIIDHYLENAALLKAALKEKGYTVFGGNNAPYLWIKLPEGIDSWQAFNHFLRNSELVTTPGSGFGPSGEGFLRFSSFGKKEAILQAADRIRRS